MNLFGPICTVFLLHTHLFVFCRLFSMPKMNMQVDWTETAKKTGMYEKHSVYVVQFTAKSQAFYFIRTTVCFLHSSQIES